MIKTKTNFGKILATLELLIIEKNDTYGGSFGSGLLVNGY